MNSHGILTAASVFMVGAIASYATQAGTVYPAPGGALTLGNSYTVSNPSTTTAAAVTINDVSANAAASYTYADGFGGPQSTISATGVPANTYGFYDNFVFTITGSDADSITSTISLSSGGVSTSLTNLDAQLYLLSGNPSLPSFSPNNAVADTLSVTSYALSPNANYSTVVLQPTASLSAGTYVLEIRGLADGAAGGSYSGVLNVTPVPLPASAWLVLSGLVGLSLLKTSGRKTLP